MKKFIVIALANFIIFTKAEINAADDLINPQLVSKIFHFPAAELVVQDVSERERRLQGDAVLRAYEITGKRPFTFYPILLSTAGEGTYMNQYLREKIGKYDSLPRNELNEMKLGFLGNLPQQDDNTGGVYLDEITTFQDDGKTRYEVVRPVIAAATHIPSKHIDIRVAIFTPFAGAGEELIPVPGGEGYFQTLGPNNFGDILTDEQNQQLEKMQVDLRRMFVGFNIAVLNSPLVNFKAAVGAPSDSLLHNATTPNATAPLKLKNSDGETAPSVAEHDAPLWPWALSAALAIAVIVGVGFRRRA